MYPFQDELYGLVTSTRDSETTNQHIEGELRGEEYERTREEYWYDLHIAAKRARSLGYTEQDILEAIRQDS